MLKAASKDSHKALGAQSLMNRGKQLDSGTRRVTALLEEYQWTLGVLQVTCQFGSTMPVQILDREYY